MRQVLAHTLVICCLSIASLGATHQPHNAASATPATVAHKKRATKSHKHYQVGKASWYGKRFHGKKTASGETYDMFQFTAAHPALPLGSVVRVTNLRNGRWVMVRINDRGPVPESRIIDLSYGAAQVLGLRDGGVDRVCLDVVPRDEVAMAQADVAGME
jgi:rare lipoprotein A